jgi:hypothetical protein
VLASDGLLVAEVCIARIGAVVDSASAVEFCAGGGTDGVVAAVVEAAVGSLVVVACVGTLVAFVVTLSVGDPGNVVCAAA